MAFAPVATVPGEVPEFPVRQLQVDVSVYQNGVLQPGEMGEPSFRHVVPGKVFYEAVMSPADKVEWLRTTFLENLDPGYKMVGDYERVELWSQVFSPYNPNASGDPRQFGEVGVLLEFRAEGLRRPGGGNLITPAEWDEAFTVGSVERLRPDLGPETWLLRNVDGPWENDPATLTSSESTIFEGVVDGDLYLVKVDRFGWLPADIVLGVPEPSTLAISFVMLLVVCSFRFSRSFAFHPE
jgi:hypothetical protein